MTDLLTFIVALGVIWYVARPLFGRRYRFSFVPLPGGNGHGDELSHLKYEALSAIKDLELEYRMGKLSREDYESMRKEYEVRAIRVLENMDMKHKGNETQKKTVRRKRIAPNKQQLEHHDKPAVNFCPHCGNRAQRGSTFCTNCGSRLAGNSQPGTR